MKIKYTDEYGIWFNSLPEKAKGRIDGALRAFETSQHDITEPHGAQVLESKYSPSVFVLYPAVDGMAFKIFCVLTHSVIFIVNGYDANRVLDSSNMIYEVDNIIYLYSPLPIRE